MRTIIDARYVPDHGLLTFPSFRNNAEANRGENSNRWNNIFENHKSIESLKDVSCDDTLRSVLWRVGTPFMASFYWWIYSFRGTQTGIQSSMEAQLQWGTGELTVGSPSAESPAEASTSHDRENRMLR